MGSRICRVDWHNNWWPPVTLNGLFTVRQYRLFWKDALCDELRYVRPTSACVAIFSTVFTFLLAALWRIKFVTYKESAVCHTSYMVYIDCGESVGNSHKMPSTLHQFKQYNRLVAMGWMQPPARARRLNLIGRLESRGFIALTFKVALHSLSYVGLPNMEWECTVKMQHVMFGEAVG